MFELYKYNKDCNKINQNKKFDIDANLKLSIRKVSLLNIFKSNHPLYDFYWLINAKGNCYVYSVFDGDKEVHHSYVTKKCYKFPFMSSQDLQIGNCYTDENYRGLGIYPYVIQKVIQRHLKNDHNIDVFMLIEEDNIASKRGVEKVGFQKVSSITIKRVLGLLKVYLPTQRVKSKSLLV